MTSVFRKRKLSSRQHTMRSRTRNDKVCLFLNGVKRGICAALFLKCVAGGRFNKANYFIDNILSIRVYPSEMNLPVAAASSSVYLVAPFERVVLLQYNR